MKNLNGNKDKKIKKANQSLKLSETMRLMLDVIVNII